MFYADLHIHSKYSLATSRDCDLEHLALWAARKGIGVVGTGDFTHPQWFSEIGEKLVPTEAGLYRLRGEGEGDSPIFAVQKSGQSPGPFFMLQAEISTVYKKDGRTRKVHHLVYVPDLDCAGRLVRSLKRIGKLSSDGRPTLGLDSRDLLEIVLGSGEGCHLIPAHIWTPWFGILGSKSGFDSIEECYGDLASEIFALETGLSSDPAMNWRLSRLDRYALVSNSDAHSPSKLGREVCVFKTKPDYFNMFRALKTGEDYGGTVEFFPEEGKYYNDGHRKCGVCLTPQQTRRCGGKCPVCGKPIALGVMHRVEELADRPQPKGESAMGTSPHPNPLPTAGAVPGEGTLQPGPLRAPTGTIHRMVGWSGGTEKWDSPIFAAQKTGPTPAILPPRAAPFRSLIPLGEVLSEIHKVGPQSKFIRQKYDELLAELGPELFILEKAPTEDIARNGSSMLAEAISRMRAGRVMRHPGFDGQYGSIRLFTDEELR